MTTLIVLFITFWLIRLLKIEVPLDKVAAQIQEQRREALGYNKPILVQFWRWISHLVRGDWGTSYFIEKLVPVSDIIKRRLVPTVTINIYSEVLIIPLGILLGIFAATKKNKWQDHVINTGVMMFMTVPSFVMCFLWMYILCYRLGWFPMQIYSLSESGGWFTGKMLYSMVPGILALTLGNIASLARQVRAELTDQIEADYMLLARAKGLTYRQAIYKHSLKNAFIPIFPGIIAGFLGLFAGSFFVENIFGIPGIGKLTLQALNTYDYDVFMSCEAFYGIIGMLATIIYDISFGIIDPRIKMGAR
ncbi:MAG: ABC transporter permease [Oscillospiraceae bacterium]|nr:ABC transporter permease [Oscillospiraceae bacterium]